MEKQTNKQQNCIFRYEHKDMTGNFCAECGTILQSGLCIKEKFRQEVYKEILKFIETERVRASTALRGNSPQFSEGKTFISTQITILGIDLRKDFNRARYHIKYTKSRNNKSVHSSEG